ncbi:MAG TPA: ABC transporter substrate-binding protein [Actinopolymorphaceae bacterium]|jgi:peptide/nickel transport system substrate-binding protein
MVDPRTSILSRRKLLVSTAAAAGGAMLVAACGSGGSSSNSSADSGTGAASSAKGSAKTALPKPAKFQQAPSLDALVKAGTLPALADRLPENPYVVPHNWVQRGKYGGLLKSTTTDTTSGALYEYTYGYSFLRYINDGIDIGPGLAEKWEVNADATVITFHFRKGLKWSDGQPWTTADIMYWWNDMVINPDHTDSPPDDVRDGKDQVAKVTAPDDLTLVLTFQSPAPVCVERIAAYVNGTTIGPRWIAPMHYIKQFHPKYNKAINPKSAWQTKHDQKLFWNMNPDCPTMVGYHCSKYSEGRAVYWDRNPFYYAVTKDGDQLPYIDKWQWVCTVDPQVQKLAMATSKVDYVHCRHWPVTLADFSTFKKAEAKGGLKVLTWDTGSGTGSITFFNFDTADTDLRNLLAEKDFRLALSYAFNRPLARKAIYFDTGELTTGTLSPKGLSFQVDDEAKKIYAQWRDSAIQFDPNKAKALLDGLGLKDTNGDGFREYKNGKKLSLRLDYPGDTSQENIDKCSRQKADWEAVGLKTEINPTAPTTFGARWGQGLLMTTTAWEIGDNSPYIYAGWVVPVANSWWAPLTGQGYVQRIAAPGSLTKQKSISPWKRQPPFLMESDGMPLAKTFAKLQNIYDAGRIEPDAMKRIKALWDIFKIHIDEGPFMYGIVANWPGTVLLHNDLRNIPTRENLALGGWTNPWFFPSPAVYDPEAYYWDNPEKHTT